MEEQFERAAEIIRKAKHMIALTGAGVSVESGIPDFRSAGGLWDKYDPSVYAHIDSFRRNPTKVWQMIFDLIDLTKNARPNPAHITLAKMEEMKLLKAIVTQNVDNLHQVAGNRSVIEYHGNASRLECLYCKKSYPLQEFKLEGVPPECPQCGQILKPSVIFFGEMIPHEAMMESNNLASDADVVMVIGTSAIVYPASSIPYIAKEKGASVIEMNVERTGLTHSITDVFIQGQVGTTLPRLLEYIVKFQP